MVGAATVVCEVARDVFGVAHATVFLTVANHPVASIDNILFPTLVGKEMRLHTLPVFLTIIGGLSLFGAAGLVLGPVTLAATVSLIDIVKRRTVKGPRVQGS